MTRNDNLNRVVELIEQEKAIEAKKVFEQIEPDESVAYLMVLGKLKQKFQNWGDAINAYTKVVELDPKHEEAKNNLHLIQNILNFWNPEMFNP